LDTLPISALLIRCVFLLERVSAGELQSLPIALRRRSIAWAVTDAALRQNATRLRRSETHSGASSLTRLGFSPPTCRRSATSSDPVLVRCVAALRPATQIRTRRPAMS